MAAERNALRFVREQDSRKFVTGDAGCTIQKRVHQKSDGLWQGRLQRAEAPDDTELQQLHHSP